MEFHIKNFFDKILNLKNKNSFLKESFIESVFVNTKIKLKLNQININNNTVFIKTSPIVKNEIFLKKDTIIDFFRKKTKINILNINWS